MDIWQILSCICLWTYLLPLVKGKIMCSCTTLDCQAERKKSCEAEFFCYAEIQNSVLTRGCVNDRTPLTCENRRSSKLKIGEFPEWPFVVCCKDDDYCNRDMVPVRPTEKTPAPAPVVDETTAKNDVNPYVRYEYEDVDQRAPCPNSSDSSKLNPIYIAVPIAGVCVLLALIIFAMYLLRRRSDMYAHYGDYQYNEQLARGVNKQNEALTCTASTAPASTCETNRCTDSERSSQGSETKLFLHP